MNKTYRSIWNDVRSCFVVVGENARSKGKPASARKAIAAAVAALFLAPGVALAAPLCVGPSPVSTALTTPQCYGDQNVTVDSSGSIKVTAGGSSTTAAYVQASPYTSTFTNNGTIRAEVTSAGWNSAYGLRFGGALSGKLNNSGTISAVVGGSSGSAYGVYVGGDLSGSLTNSGTISATNKATSYSAYAYGVAVSGNLSGSLTNSGTISASANATDSNYAYAYGVRVSGDLSGSLTNTGTISAVASNDDTGAYAFGVAVGSLSGTINNSGTISATANQLSSYAYAYGVMVGSLDATGKLINSGTISATANATYPYYAEAYGVYVSGNVAAGGEITNSKTISATARGGDGSYMYAYGVYVGGDLAGSLTNTSSGTISATASTIGSTNGYPYAFGVYVGNDLSGALSNAGTITATASGASPSTAYAYGVYVGNALSGTLTNSGTISATAAAPSSYAYAYGVYVGGDLAGALTNTSSGTISATAIAPESSAYAYGVYVNGNLSTLTNAGTISATAKSASYAYAYGVYIGGDLSGTLTNSGTISATANASANGSDAYAYGVYVSGNLTGSLINRGTISANATSLNSDAYAATAIYIGGDLGATGVLNNSGTISATATAYSYASDAKGIHVSGNLAGSLINSGTITATAVTPVGGYAYAYGIYVGGDLSGTLTHTGTISAKATATSSYAEAYGISVGSLTGTLTSSGTISAAASAGTDGYAYGVYVGSLGGTVNNSGTISATGAGAVASSNVYSIYASGGSGTINNQAGGLLDGQVYAGGTVSLNNAGTIDTRLEASFVGGNYTQAATGLLKIGATDNATYGKLNVGGTANLTAGTGITLTGTTGNTLAAGTLAGVITSGGLTFTSATVSDNILALQFAAVANGNNVDLTASATGLTSVAAATAGTSGAGAGVALDTLLANIGNQTGELQNYLYALGSAGTQQGVRNAVAQILPLISGGVTQVALGAAQGTNRVVQARQEGNQGRSSGDQFYGDQHFWLKPFGSWANQDNHNGVSGYDATTYGMVVGADADVAEVDTRVGAAFGYARSDVDGNSSVARQSANVDSYQLVIYGSHNLDADTDVNFQAGVGRHNVDGRRRISFGGTSLLAKSDYHSWSRSIGGGIARTMKWSDKTSFTPSLRADYIWIRDNSYGETGAGTLNLNVGTNRTEQFIVAADGKFTHALSNQTMLTGNLGVGYDLINDRASIASTMAGTPTVAFATKGIDSSPWVLRGGAGMVYRADERTEVTARYDVEGREDFTNQTASVKVRWAF